jgi:hypothetical protein
LPRNEGRRYCEVIRLLGRTDFQGQTEKGKKHQKVDDIFG